MATIICPERRPQMGTVRPGVFHLGEYDEERKRRVLQEDSHEVEIIYESPKVTPDQIRTKLLKRIKEVTEIVDLESAEIIVAGGVTDYVAADADASCVTIRETDQFVKELSFPINKIFVSGEPDKMKEVERILQRKFGSVLNVFRSDPYYVELLPKYTDKGVAVDKLVKYMDITKERVMCVGDSNNDLPMLRYAGMGVAMGNASDRIKEQADYVTDSNDDDGIVKVIEKFMTEAHHEEG